MQAYAGAESSLRQTRAATTLVPPQDQAAVLRVGAAPIKPSSGIASASSLLGALIVEDLDDRSLAALAERLFPHLQSCERLQPKSGAVAYTVSSLAAEIGVSPKTIRCAIARRELCAVKRGTRWIISAEAVQTWATAAETRRKPSHACAPVAPKAAGPSLRSVICGQQRFGGGR